MTAPLIRRGWDLYKEQRPLMWTGLLGFVLAGACFATMLAQGRIMAPEGDLFKAGTFDFAFGIYCLTVALLARAAGFTPRGVKVWSSSLALLTLTAYGLETIQILGRGLDPRFTQHGSPADQLLGGFFFLVAQGIIVNFLVLGWKFFRPGSMGHNPLLTLSVRYAALGTFIAFGAGYLMSAFGGSAFGDTGDWLPLHAAGFHGLQAVPLVALFTGRSILEESKKRLWVHLAGLTWTGACLALAYQTSTGRAVSEPGLVMYAALLLFATWGVIAANSVLAARRPREEAA